MVNKYFLSAESALFSILAGAMLVAGCSENSPRPSEPVFTADPAGNFVVSMPEQLKNIRAINSDALFADIVINGQSTRWSQSTDYITTVFVAPGSTLAVSIQWKETQADNSELLLASRQFSQIITEDMTIGFTSSDYETAFDDDEDGFSNLEERQSCSSPQLATSTPENCPDVRIGWINPLEAPDIDGLYDSIWDRAQFFDEYGDSLEINNLMIDQGATRLDGEAEFRWFAMHDDTYLYLFVLGEIVDIAMPFRDSTDVWDDDNINLYFDGDNSKLSSYDGVDDRQILVPLLTSPVNPDSNSTFFVEGANSAPLPDFDFATCLCSSREHTWEFKIPMAEFNIQKNQPFGFEIQLDDDNDGGARDSKWGWFHPSRTTEDVDNTWTNPSFMGIAVVE